MGGNAIKEETIRKTRSRLIQVVGLVIGLTGHFYNS
jgi:hypothetical protein